MTIDEAAQDEADESEAWPDPNRYAEHVARVADQAQREVATHRYTDRRAAPMTTTEPLDLPEPLTDDQLAAIRMRLGEGTYASEHGGQIYKDGRALLGEVKRLREREAKIRLLLPERPGLDHLLHQFVNPAMLRDILDGGTLYADYLTRKAKP
jgi:hypothetical protein